MSPGKPPSVLIDVLFIQKIVNCVMQRIDLLPSKASHEHISAGPNICFPLRFLDLEHSDYFA